MGPSSGLKDTCGSTQHFTWCWDLNSDFHIGTSQLLSHLSRMALPSFKRKTPQYVTKGKNLDDIVQLIY